eukprot:7812299-Alexandrium_andersonii.AAC.1
MCPSGRRQGGQGRSTTCSAPRSRRATWAMTSLRFTVVIALSFFGATYMLLFAQLLGGAAASVGFPLQLHV